MRAGLKTTVDAYLGFSAQLDNLPLLTIAENILSDLLQAEGRDSGGWTLFEVLC
jgi:hypothetical protein